MAEISEQPEDVNAPDVLSLEELTNSVWKKVRLWTSGQVRKLEITLEEGPPLTVMITGTCRTYYAKVLATHAVLDYFRDSPCQVDNTIEVL